MSSGLGLDSTGDQVTAGDLNSSFTVAAQTNHTPSCGDDYSSSASQMQTNTDPYAGATESLATSLAGELERLRFMFKNLFGLDQWYRHDQNVNLAGIGVTRTGVQGAGSGAHISAVGLHTWSGSTRFPAITSVAAHTSGIFWPAAHHMAISIDSGDATAQWFTNANTDKRGTEIVRFHARGMILHHTAALMFAHSEGAMHNGQRGHITAISVSRGLVSATGDEAAGRDTLIFGHSGAVMQLVADPAGASHIALGRHSYLTMERHLAAFPSPRRNALYGSLIPKAWLNANGASATATQVRGGFNIAGVTRTGAGLYTVRFLTPMLDANYAAVCNGSAQETRVVQTGMATGTFDVETFGSGGAAADAALIACVVFGDQ